MADYVTVACKLPNGLVIDLKQEDGTYAAFTLNGAFKAPGVLDRRVKETAPGEVGLTPIPKEFWNKWSELNKDFAPFKNGLIFAQKNPREALAEARDKESVKTGLERLEKPKEPIIDSKKA